MYYLVKLYIFWYKNVNRYLTQVEKVFRKENDIKNKFKKFLIGNNIFEVAKFEKKKDKEQFKKSFNYIYNITNNMDIRILYVYYIQKYRNR